MKYSTENMQISVTLDLAAFLKAQGYSIFWHEAGTLEVTSVNPTRGTLTIIAEIPANAEPFVGLKSESGGPDEIVVPALTLYMPGLPRRVRIEGIGHKDYEWERDIRIDAFALDSREHRQLADLLHSWLQREEFQEIPVSDYDANANTPDALEPVRVIFSDVRREELVNENVAVRYYIHVEATLQYIE